MEETRQGEERKGKRERGKEARLEKKGGQRLGGVRDVGTEESSRGGVGHPGDGTNRGPAKRKFAV